MARYFPVFLDLSGRRCLVVGAGGVATAKAAQLLRYGADVTIVAPDATDTVHEWAEAGAVRYLARPFQPDDIQGALLVVASTSDPAVNSAVYAESTARGVLVNVVDIPDLCSFIYGAIVEQGDLQIAVSTSGRSPAYAAHLRVQLQERFGPEYAVYVDILGEAREKARRDLPGLDDQRQSYARLLALDLLDLIRAGHPEEARRRALECVSASPE